MGDEYGDEWTTRPIPTVVRLSQTISTASTAHLDFGNTPGIHVSEVSIGDIIRVGQSYRKVTKLQYRQDDSNTLDASRQYYQKIYFQEALPSATTIKTEQSASVYRTAGTPVYRVTVAKEIREALRALPNDRIPDVTVEAVTRGGAVLNEKTKGAATGTTIEHYGDLDMRKVSVGDLIRYGNEIRQVKELDGSTPKKKYKVTEAFGTVGNYTTLYIQNGMTYDITFEAGCRTHEDCRYNGVDENDSDGPPTDRLIEGLGTNAAYCHRGGTCMCSFDANEQALFTGPGCTKTGRGTHKNAKVTVSGDIYNLKCDTTVRTHNGVTNGLTPSFVHAESATVARISPQTITLSDNAVNVNVGDHVRIEDQVRTVTSAASNSKTVTVDQPFEEIGTSDIVNIFPALTPVNVIKEIGGVRTTCTVSDLRRLTSTVDSCDSVPSSTKQLAACGEFGVTSADAHPDLAKRQVTPTNTGSLLMDEREVEIGDRIRVITSAGNWNTRTVDSVTYTNGEVSGFVVSEPYEDLDTGMELYNDGAGTTEAKTCSGRGLCDDSSGECQCFKGYSGVDCSQQNALAV